jgi:hypothetical protein
VPYPKQLQLNYTVTTAAVEEDTSGAIETAGVPRTSSFFSSLDLKTWQHIIICNRSQQIMMIRSHWPSRRTRADLRRSTARYTGTRDSVIYDYI